MSSISCSLTNWDLHPAPFFRPPPKNLWSTKTTDQIMKIANFSRRGEACAWKLLGEICRPFFLKTCSQPLARVTSTSVQASVGTFCLGCRGMDLNGWGYGYFTYLYMGDIGVIIHLLIIYWLPGTSKWGISEVLFREAGAGCLNLKPPKFYTL